MIHHHSLTEKGMPRYISPFRFYSVVDRLIHQYFNWIGDQVVSRGLKYTQIREKEKEKKDGNEAKLHRFHALHLHSYPERRKKK
ncbi:unnamed protein product [Periconia digitata]|uniref:Uncharacterized protein n=1 Tax=Periconia digitata TaxID=1303443 RepID=A0A9W4UN31_9PLEO|nr:unnamed protein product [Periconia digitata]